MFKKMKPVIDEKIIWFAYYQNRPIASFLNLPDLNQWFKHLNGKFGIFQKLYFLWLQQFKKNKKFSGLAFGIVPEFQGKGIDAFIMQQFLKSSYQADVITGLMENYQHLTYEEVSSAIICCVFGSSLRDPRN